MKKNIQILHVMLFIPFITFAQIDLQKIDDLEKLNQAFLNNFYDMNLMCRYYGPLSESNTYLFTRGIRLKRRPNSWELHRVVFSPPTGRLRERVEKGERVCMFQIHENNGIYRVEYFFNNKIDKEVHSKIQNMVNKTLLSFDLKIESD